MEEPKKRKLTIRFPSKIKFSKWDIISIIALIIFIILVAIPVYSPKAGCEISSSNTGTEIYITIEEVK